MGTAGATPAAFFSPALPPTLLPDLPLLYRPLYLQIDLQIYRQFSALLLVIPQSPSLAKKSSPAPWTPLGGLHLELFCRGEHCGSSPLQPPLTQALPGRRPLPASNHSLSGWQTRPCTSTPTWSSLGPFQPAPIHPARKATPPCWSRPQQSELYQAYPPALPPSSSYSQLSSLQPACLCYTPASVAVTLVCNGASTTVTAEFSTAAATATGSRLSYLLPDCHGNLRVGAAWYCLSHPAALLPLSASLSP